MKHFTHILIVVDLLLWLLFAWVSATILVEPHNRVITYRPVEWGDVITFCVVICAVAAHLIAIVYWLASKEGHSS
jgi:hypothetical protein